MNGPERKDAERERRRDEVDEVEEASLESFPASDPPAFGPVSGAGAPARPDDEPVAPDAEEQGDRP